MGVADDVVQAAGQLFAVRAMRWYASSSVRQRTDSTPAIAHKDEPASTRACRGERAAGAKRLGRDLPQRVTLANPRPLMARLRDTSPHPT
jgi:hypothetical protein